MQVRHDIVGRGALRQWRARIERAPPVDHRRQRFVLDRDLNGGVLCNATERLVAITIATGTPTWQTSSTASA
jgi:hypothetical protein